MPQDSITWLPISLVVKILLVIFTTSGSLVAQSGRSNMTPIFVQLTGDEAMPLLINNTKYSENDALLRLKEFSDKFGRADPVLIETTNFKDLAPAVTFGRRFLATQDFVYLAVSQPHSEEKILYIQVTADQPH